MSETWALLPFKRLCEAKRRLAPVLESHARQSIARAMATDVLTALSASDGLMKILLVTNEPEAGNLFPGRGIEIFYSARTEGLNRELEQAAAYATSRGAGRILIVHTDLPFLTPDSIDRLLTNATESEVCAVPCKSGSGTNALLLPTPLPFRPLFGRDSLVRHRDLASHWRLGFQIARDPRLETDIDSPADLELLRNGEFAQGLPGKATQLILQYLEHHWPKAAS